MLCSYICEIPKKMVIQRNRARLGREWGHSVLQKKSDMRHPQLLRHYGEPSLVAPCGGDASLSGAHLTYFVIHRTIFWANHVFNLQAASMH